MLTAKTVIPNKFWILESSEGIRKGTLSVQVDHVRAVIGNDASVYDNLNKACGVAIILKMILKLKKKLSKMTMCKDIQLNAMRLTLFGISSVSFLCLLKQKRAERYTPQVIISLSLNMDGYKVFVQK